MFNKRASYLHRALVIGLCLTVYPAFAPSAHAQVGLGLAPMRVELRMAPGQEYSNTVKLSSQSGLNTRVRAEVLDFDIDESATPQFERNQPKEAATSCKDWLTLNPMEMAIDKDGFLNVRYTIHLPAGLPEGSYNCAAGFTTLPAVSEANGGMGLNMAVRVVGAFYIVVGTPPVIGKLDEISLEATPAVKGQDAGFQAVVVLSNSGKMYFRPIGTLDVLDANGKTIETDEFQSLPVLRERSQRFVFPLKTHLGPGQYKLRARVDIGTGEVQEGDADVTVDAVPPVQKAEK
jgi:hypothetical protein